MSFAAALNCTWVLISLCALIVFAAAERPSVRANSQGRLKRLLAVIFLVVSLFPCVSVSDDLLGFSYFQSLRKPSGAASSEQPGGPGSPAQPGDESSSRSLMRVLSAVEALQVAAIFVFAVVLATGALIALSLFENRSPELACLSGRGPPLPAR